MVLTVNAFSSIVLSLFLSLTASAYQNVNSIHFFSGKGKNLCQIHSTFIISEIPLQDKAILYMHHKMHHKMRHKIDYVN